MWPPNQNEEKNNFRRRRNSGVKAVSLREAGEGGGEGDTVWKGTCLPQRRCQGKRGRAHPTWRRGVGKPSRQRVSAKGKGATAQVKAGAGLSPHTAGLRVGLVPTYPCAASLLLGCCRGGKSWVLDPFLLSRHLQVFLQPLS